MQLFHKLNILSWKFTLNKYITIIENKKHFKIRKCVYTLDF